MKELISLDNKSKKELYKYTFVCSTAVITWLLQVSIISNIQFFNASPNLLLLACIFVGLTLGPVHGLITGLIISFFSVSVLFDHIFYFSYPLAGFLAGFILKNVFSDDLFFFLILCSIFSLPVEILNYFQLNSKGVGLGISKIFVISFSSLLQNIAMGFIFYYFMKLILNRLNFR